VIAEVASERKGKERFNDGKVDQLGRLWIGTVLEGEGGVVPGGGSLYRLHNGQFLKMESNFTLSNGITHCAHFVMQAEYSFIFIRNGLESQQHKDVLQR